jgi:hypothetical protein
MSVIGNTLPTLADLAKRLDPKGATIPMVEQLQRNNPIIMDAVFKEGNLQTGERVSTRTGLPAIGYRRFNEGITPSKGQSDTFDETCAMIEGLHVVDADLAELNGGAAYRMQEGQGFVQSFENEVETGFIYNSTKVSPEKFMGFSPRLDATAGNPAASQIKKMDPAAAGNDQSSVWFVAWGLNSVYGIVPKGSKAGLTHKDLGTQLWDDGTGKKFEALVSKWKWNVGLVVKDWRYIVRLANIDTGNLAKTGDALIVAMIEALDQLQDLNTGRVAIYTNRKISTYLKLQARDTTKNSTISLETVDGRPVTMFGGVPVRRTDAILNTEAPVV